MVSEGSQEESEFKISRSLIGEEINLAIVFYQIMAKDKFAIAPETLDDGSVNKELVVGGNVNPLKFKPETRLKLILK